MPYFVVQERYAGYFMNNHPIRILLCEDQTLMRQGLHTVLELEPGFEVVGEAANGEKAIQRYEELHKQGKGPDIVLMDIQMPCKNGVQATAAITIAHPEARIIMLTTFDYEDYVFEAVKAGAMGYILKDVPAEELAGTIRKVHAGEPFIQPKVASKLLVEFGRKGRPTTGHRQPTWRESEKLFRAMIHEVGLSTISIESILSPGCRS